ncbi:MAG: acetyltransferase [Luminiphilus sp.]|nr:acetyltransferase [Luminiphilus sp.]
MGYSSDISGILIWGAGSQSKLLARLVDEITHLHPADVTIFDPATELSKAQPRGTIQGMEALCERFPNLSHHVVAIGAEHGRARVEIGRQLELLGLHPLSVISQQSYIASSVRVGKGVVIMPGATLNHFAALGDYCIVNTNASVDHECILGDGVHVMGAAAIAGRVNIEGFASVGTNATVLPDLTVGSGALVAAGAVVTKSVGMHTIVSGIPARQTSEVVAKSTFPPPKWFATLRSHFK